MYAVYQQVYYVYGVCVRATKLAHKREWCYVPRTKDDGKCLLETNW